jgi:hypothetical protein
VACAFIKPIHCRFVNHVAAESVYEMLRVGRLSQSSQDAGPLAHRLIRLRFAARGQVHVQVRRVICPEWSRCANEAALSFSLTIATD